ncbi:hypothetical protein T4B_5440 [Trichinella pseudospiralis]|uniref:Uncharacterized protein n=1 Tax=Trichinella pseudospiralis TaxID=6337 RepID=A0A0V1I3D0_TRIPS|nr:hypothetical protein T4A_7800 [Trichinella pseudospiralis]KRZ16754.1 hypothetical protein T4B_5440 [Trichinella pseudospiralis]KRZ32659.1 hypothetical protein T4C_3712 [Trichinella pseudospiralis]
MKNTILDVQNPISDGFQIQLSHKIICFECYKSSGVFCLNLNNFTLKVYLFCVTKPYKSSVSKS